MTRDKVFAIINRERAYQNKKWGGYEHDAPYDSSAWSFIVDDLVDEFYASHVTHEERMIVFRKIAAVCVAAMEYNDTPDRIL